MINKNFALILGILIIISACASDKNGKIDSIPDLLTGKFMDDYEIQYEINDTLWTQHPNVNFHIIEWNNSDQFILVKNDANNPSEPEMFTRIDYMLFDNMEPYLWGFCLTTYNAMTLDEAEANISADRDNPKIGCNGHPFSRMKRID